MIITPIIAAEAVIITNPTTIKGTTNLAVVASVA